MKKTPIIHDSSEYPAELRSFLVGADVYDSSCSDAAKVIFIDKGDGFYLKRACAGSLRAESDMTRYFHGKGLAPEVIAYTSDGRYDFLLTAAAHGEDGTHNAYLSDPRRLCDLLAESMRALHESDTSGCPVPDRMADYFAFAEVQYVSGGFGNFHLPDRYKFPSADAAWKSANERRHLLHSDVLIHGDFCLPNVIFSDWRLSAYIDVGNGGIGDRHVDLFWAAWSLGFNFHTDKYTDRFFDAYGRDAINTDALYAVAAFETFG